MVRIHFYPISVTGLNISTCCRAIQVQFNFLINPSVFPKNIELQIISIKPRCLDQFKSFSRNIFNYKTKK
jgi:hypothetical protein